MAAEGALQLAHRRAPLALAAAVVVIVAMGALVWETFPPPFVAAARVAWRLGLLAILLGAFAGWGALLCRLLRVERGSWIATTAAGAVATSTVVAYLAPWWFPDALFTTPWLLFGWLLLLPHFAARRRASRAADRDSARAKLLASPVEIAAPAETIAPPANAPPSPTVPSFQAAPSSPAARTGTLLPWIAALLFLQLPLAVAISPAVGLDSLIYHLAIPRQAALYGRLVEMPWLVYSWFPQHAEMLYGVALALDGAVLAQLLHLVAAIATVLIAARLAARAYGPTAAAWTALLLASAPILNLIAGAAGNDWFVLLYLVLALEQRARVDEAASAYKLEALFLGAAVATKYTALPALALLLVPWRKPSWRRLAVQAALILAVALPWYGRNLLLRGNPVYPLLGDSPAAQELSHFRGDAALLAKLRGYLFEPDLIDESMGLLLPAALAIAAIMLPGRRRDRPALLRSELLLLLLLYAAPILFTHPTARSFTPLLLAGAILGGGGMALLAATPALRRALCALVLVVLPLHLVHMLVVWDFDGHHPVRALAGIVDEDGYLRHSQPYIDAYRALARHAPPNARVLVVGEGRAFYLDRRAVWGSVVDPHPFAAFAGTPPEAARAARRLREAGIGFVVSYPPQQKVGPRPPGIRYELEFHASPALDRALKQLLAEHARPVYHRGNSWIYALAPPSAPPPAASPGANAPAIDDAVATPTATPR